MHRDTAGLPTGRRVSDRPARRAASVNGDRPYRARLRRDRARSAPSTSTSDPKESAITSISSLGNVLAASGAGATNATSKTSPNELGKDDFMKLLVAQLRYQDPNSPADPSQFMAQTAQFTMVEKLGALADSQQQMVTAQLQFGASNLVGKTVSYTDADGKETTGVVTVAKFLGSNPTVHVGNTDVPLSSVKEVRSSTAG
jgi:flagellar basal-body rod modification protein FlgD